MRTTFVKIAEHFNTLANGAPMVVGFVGDIHMVDFPAQFPPFVAVVEVEYEPLEAESPGTLELSIIDEDGKRLWGVRLDVMFAKPRDRRPGRWVQGIPIRNLQLEGAGEYRLDVLYNGIQIGSERVRVHRAQVPLSPGEP